MSLKRDDDDADSDCATESDAGSHSDSEEHDPFQASPDSVPADEKSE